MKPGTFQQLSALCGITGVVLLITSFILNPSPGPNPTAHELAVFGNSRHATILLGAWLQAVSPFLIMIFALGSIRLVGATSSFPGQLTQVGFVVLIVVSLLEVVFYLSAANGDPATAGLISLDLIHGTQHLFSIAAAPAVFLPFAVVILRWGLCPAHSDTRESSSGASLSSWALSLCFDRYSTLSTASRSLREFGGSSPRWCRCSALLSPPLDQFVRSSYLGSSR